MNGEKDLNKKHANENKQSISAQVQMCTAAKKCCNCQNASLFTSALPNADVRFQGWDARH